MEQNVRYSRISILYERTTGIQALDLLGRKVLMTQGEALKGYTKSCTSSVRPTKATSPFRNSWLRWQR